MLYILCILARFPLLLLLYQLYLISKYIRLRVYLQHIFLTHFPLYMFFFILGNGRLVIEFFHSLFTHSVSSSSSLKRQRSLEMKSHFAVILFFLTYVIIKVVKLFSIAFFSYICRERNEDFIKTKLMQFEI